MAKLYFYYSAMNAGKSTILLQSSYNYRERGMNTLILVPEIDNRFRAGKVTSRIGIEADAVTFNVADTLLKIAQRTHEQDPIHYVLVNEAQFLTKVQVRQLSEICDQHDIPVLTYGLRTAFQGRTSIGKIRGLRLTNLHSYTFGEGDDITHTRSFHWYISKNTFRFDGVAELDFQWLKHRVTKSSRGVNKDRSHYSLACSPRCC